MVKLTRRSLFELGNEKIADMFDIETFVLFSVVCSEPKAVPLVVLKFGVKLKRLVFR